MSSTSAFGVNPKDRLDCRANTNTEHKKQMARLYFLTESRSFMAWSKMPEILSQSAQVPSTMS